MKKLLIINIETKAREFNSRLMIAHEALKRNYEVLIGAQKDIIEILGHLPKGIFFDKSISKNKFKRLKKIRNLGHKIVSLDEEGMASQNNQHFYLKQRFSKDTLELTECLFTWGENEKNLILSKYPEYENKIRNTGNPRIEVWKPKYSELHKNEIEQIQKKYEDFILITSNFASIQHARGDEFLKEQETNYNRIETKKDEEISNNKKNFLKRVYLAFLDMIKFVAKSLPDRTIVIRPHPGDNIKTWKENFKNYKNVFIEYEYSATPWIKASKCMIHSSCTTGIEGYLSKKPLFSFLPYKDNAFVNFISNSLSDVCDTKEQILEKISCVFDQKYEINPLREEKEKKTTPILENFNNFKSVTNILDQIDDIKVPFYSEINNFDLKIFQTKKIFKNKIKKIFNNEEKVDSYNNQKMPGLSLEEVILKLKIIERINSLLNKNRQFNVSELSDNVFLLKKIRV